MFQKKKKNRGAVAKDTAQWVGAYTAQIPGTPALGRWKQHNLEFKVILGYIGSLRLAWATQDQVWTKPNQTNKNETTKKRGASGHEGPLASLSAGGRHGSVRPCSSSLIPPVLLKPLLGHFLLPRLTTEVQLLKY